MLNSAEGKKLSKFENGAEEITQRNRETIGWKL